MRGHSSAFPPKYREYFTEDAHGSKKRYETLATSQVGWSD
jgi:hypothetical protein